jgi:uncharacterized iron-regulated membrane protein
MNVPGTTQAGNSLRRFIQRPQRVWLRRACFQIHLWMGVLLSLYIAAIGVSGSILVFKDELMPRPKFHQAQSEPLGCTPASLVAAVRATAIRYPETIIVLATCPMGADPFYQINVRPTIGAPFTAYVNPATDVVAGEVDQASNWIGMTERFHLELLLHRNGRQWNGLGAAILVVLCVTGLVIWWPGIRNWRRALKVNLNLNWKRINFDLHSAIGIWVLSFTAIWAVTGVYFAWETPFERLIAAVSPITTARYPEKEIRQATTRAAASLDTGFDVRATLEEAVAVIPHSKLEGFFFGSTDAPVYMAHGQLGDYANTDFVYFNQRNGQYLLTWYRGVNHTLGDWILWLFVPLHFGTSFGTAGKVTWAALGLVFPVLAITGLLMYWNRWLSKRIPLMRT